MSREHNMMGTKSMECWIGAHLNGGQWLDGYRLKRSRREGAATLCGIGEERWPLPPGNLRRNEIPLWMEHSNVCHPELPPSPLTRLKKMPQIPNDLTAHFWAFQTWVMKTLHWMRARMDQPANIQLLLVGHNPTLINRKKTVSLIPASESGQY